MNKQWAERLAAVTAIDNAKELVDYLQERGVVSDNCVTLSDVADIDAGKAYIRFLHETH